MKSDSFVTLIVALLVAVGGGLAWLASSTPAATAQRPTEAPGLAQREAERRGELLAVEFSRRPEYRMQLRGEASDRPELTVLLAEDFLRSLPAGEIADLGAYLAKLAAQVPGEKSRWMTVRPGVRAFSMCARNVDRMTARSWTVIGLVRAGDQWIIGDRIADGE